MLARSLVGVGAQTRFRECDLVASRSRRWPLLAADEKVKGAAELVSVVQQEAAERAAVGTGGER